MAKILITDDAQFMRMMIREAIKENGYEIVEAENGEDMLAKYESFQPDLVTLDITMPSMDGITALKELRAKHADAKVIMVSAMGQQAMVIDAIKNGAKDFVVKPFDPEKVRTAIEKQLAS